MKTFDVFLRNKLVSSIIYIRELEVKHDLGIRNKFILKSSKIVFFLYREIFPRINGLILKTRSASLLETTFAKPVSSRAVLKIFLVLRSAANIYLQRLKTRLRTPLVSLLETVFAGGFRARLSLKNSNVNLFKQGIIKINLTAVLRSSAASAAKIGLESLRNFIILFSAVSAALKYFIRADERNKFILRSSKLQLYKGASIGFMMKTVLRNSNIGVDLAWSIRPANKLILSSVLNGTFAVKYPEISHIIILNAGESTLTLIKFVAPGETGMTLSSAVSASRSLYRKLGDMDGDGLGVYDNMSLFDVDYIEI